MSQPAKKPIRRLLSTYEENTLKTDRRQLEAVIADPKLENKDEARAALKRTIAHQADACAPDLNPEQRDKLAKRTAMLEEQLKHGLLSSEEMRRNPHGAVTANVRWERENSQKVVAWRNGLRALNRGMANHEMDDLCSVERLRPRQNSLSMLQCEIPQKNLYSFPSESFKANYEDIDFRAEPPKSAGAELLEDLDEPAKAHEMPDFGDMRKPANRALRDAWLADHPE